MMKSIYIPQIDENDCGAAALAMVLKFYGSYYSNSFLRALERTDKCGTTALGIVEAAEKLKLKTTAIQSDFEYLEKRIEKYVSIYSPCDKNGIIPSVYQLYGLVLHW